MKKFILFAAVILTALSSCVKNTLAPVPAKLSATPAITGPDVYVAGTMSAANGKTIAIYWKNGVLTKLSDSSLNTSAIDIAVSGNDVYVLGNISDVGVAPHPVYWKNGIQHTLDYNEIGVANAFAIKGNDVYVVGQTMCSSGPGLQAVIWTNGALHILAYDHPYGSAANAITLSGNDIYVAGYTTSATSDNTAATYWKNGAPKKLVDSVFYPPSNQYVHYPISIAFGITINGNDIYVAGSATQAGQGVREEAVYWKNNVFTDLNSGAAEAHTTVVNGNDVTILGKFNGSAGQGPFVYYWENGVVNTLVSPDTYSSMAGGIASGGDDIYISAVIGQLHGTPISGYPKSLGYYKNTSFTSFKTIPPDDAANSPVLSVGNIVLVPR